MKVLVHACNERSIPISHKVIFFCIAYTKGIADRFVNDSNYFSGTITESIASDIKLLWSDEGISKKPMNGKANSS